MTGLVCVWAALRALGQVEAPYYGGGRCIVWSKVEPSWRDKGLSDYSQLWVLPVIQIFLLCFTFVLWGAQQNVETINHILDRNENRQWREGNGGLEKGRVKVRIDLGWKLMAKKWALIIRRRFQVNVTTPPPFAGKLFLWLLEKEESPTDTQP